MLWQKEVLSELNHYQTNMHVIFISSSLFPLTINTIESLSIQTYMSKCLGK